MEQKKQRTIKRRSRRKNVNMVSMMVTVFVLGLVLMPTGASFTKRIMDISTEMSKALNRNFELENTTYTEVNETVIYVMDVTFDPKSMAGLYNITTWFMDLIQPKEVFPADVNLLNEDGKLVMTQLIDNLPSLLKHYAGLLALTILGLLFAILMPLVGLVFCCCRCCGNCGARSQPFDKKHDMCKKVFLAMLLIAVVTILLFGVVCAFVSNQHMQEGTENIPVKLQEGLKDTKTYINHTNIQINILLTTNFQELQKSLNTILNKSSIIVSDKLKEFSNAASFTNLANFVGNLSSMSEDLKYMKFATNTLRSNASLLSDGLRKVKKDLIYTLINCIEPNCIGLRNDISKLKTTIEFDKLPDVSHSISELSNILSGSLLEKMKQGQDSFNSIEENIKASVEKNIPTIEKAITDAGESLKSGSDDIGATLQRVSKMLSDNNQVPIQDVDKFIKTYSKYRYYLGIGESSILLLVILCITFGLMCGVCGKRPDGYDDDCCNKGAGSKFLMMGVCIMFLFSFLLMLITLIYFLTGMVSQRLFCDTLQNPQNNKLFSMLDQILDINKIVSSNISNIIQTCHYNESAYNVLKLENNFNMSEVGTYLDKFNITSQIENFEKQIHFNQNIQIFDNDTEKEIMKLKDSGIGEISFYRFTDILEHNITSIDLVELSEKLLLLAQTDAIKNIEDIQNSLKQNAMFLESYQRNIVDPMVTTAVELKIRAEKLDNQLKLNKSENSEGFEAVLGEVIKEVNNAQDYITKNGTIIINEIAVQFGNSFKNKIDGYLQHVVQKVTTNVGKCGPLSNVYNASLVATCDNILNPWNGFWISVGWCLILFIPAIILSVKLATLYQISDPYPGRTVEAEYLYDAYADRDNIPLSNTPHKKGKKKKRGGDSNMYDTRGAYSGDTSRGAEPHSLPHRDRDAPRSNTHHETRYDDMAPKHWEDYPNGGPPQYQSAPMATEYERPPPYYYPGPGDRP